MNYPAELPIVAKRDEIVAAIAAHPVLVITGATGSGKSTQIPKMCLEAGRGAGRWIGCTQPRRIAALTLAQRVADELDPAERSWVGYKIRFQDRTSRSTRIKFMTDGVLLAETQSDRLLRGYDTIIVDEAHERSLNIDFLIGILRRNRERRPDLKVIITSATIDPEKFSAAFDQAPIIEVTGRTYPVTVRYRPPTPEEAESGEEITPIDRAIRAVRELKRQGERGDILIFMPTESDIRETAARLEAAAAADQRLVLPLFGRLAAADQKRIFQPSDRPKIVVATNVAETSITIPGIKVVIDTGLARIAQYNPRTRTQGLPIVPISRAAADQRKGRCGRVMAGTCIRLYGEEDYAQRPAFTPPEIQRANLAEVILRMLALRLGEVQDFPFLDPPAPAAVKDGFAVLQELGAVDDHRRLTAIGRTMARLPLDPRLARLLLAGRRQGALAEMVVICAALSIQDPRERPLENEAQADQAHARFRDRRSDFVTLLRLWSAFQEQRRTAKSRGQIRRFCREHFLSYRRMQEWQDLHDELLAILDDLGGFPLNQTPASYDALHRAVAAGFLSHIAQKKEKNQFVGARGRQVTIFPGSGLFNRAGDWVVAAEWVQTSRLFARTVAVIEPQWLEELGRHLCRRSYLDPHWERKAGRVVAREQVTLYGLRIVDGRKVDYGRVNPAEAREIFIRSALMAGDLAVEYPFLDHNRRLLEAVAAMEDKLRRRELLVDEEAIFAFYDRRLPQLSDLRSLNHWLKEAHGDQTLRMTEADLLRHEPDRDRLDRFPDHLDLEDARLPLRYRFDPGADDDGMTVVVPLHLLPRLRPEPFEWLVPGLLREKLAALLKALPKSTRRLLVPIPTTVDRILDALTFGRGDLHRELSRVLRELTGVTVAADQWARIQADPSWPPHLSARFEVVAEDGEAPASGRLLAELQQGTVAAREDRLWQEARARWERSALKAWDFGPVPFEIPLGRDAYGIERRAYSGFAAEPDGAALRLFANREEALEATRDGLLLLYQWELAPVIKAHAKDWRFPPEPASALLFLGDRRAAERDLQLYLLRDLFALWEPQSPDHDRFQSRVRELRGTLGSEARARLDEVLEVLRRREETRRALALYLQRSSGNPGAVAHLRTLEQDLYDLVPSDFLRRARRAWLIELPRYLRALKVRAERAYVAPAKDRQKEQELEPQRRRLRQAELATAAAGGAPPLRQFLDEFRTMVEEFKISLFAPEIKTRFRISPKRLDEKWREWQLLCGKVEP